MEVKKKHAILLHDLVYKSLTQWKIVCIQISNQHIRIIFKELSFIYVTLQNAGQNHDIKIAKNVLIMWHSSDIWERL
jgi:hypothetical protein